LRLTEGIRALHAIEHFTSLHEKGNFVAAVNCQLFYESQDSPCPLGIFPSPEWLYLKQVIPGSKH
jgi:hypothetical protein